jgi:hypothetical protein
MRSRGLFPVHRTFFKELAGYLEAAGVAERDTVDRASVDVLPIWEVLDRTGFSIGIVDGYYPSYPAIVPRHPDGYFVAYGAADAYRRLAHDGGTGGTPPNGAAADGMPADATALAAYVEPPALVATVAPFLDRDELAWQASATLALLDARPHPRFLSVYTRQPDNFEHRFWKWYEPERFLHVRAADVATKGDVIPRVYEQLDAFVAGVLARRS